jgi:hypothetical protein
MFEYFNNLPAEITAMGQVNFLASKFTGCPYMQLLYSPLPSLKKLQISLAFDRPLWS